MCAAWLAIFILWECCHAFAFLWLQLGGKGGESVQVSCVEVVDILLAPLNGDNNSIICNNATRKAVGITKVAFMCWYEKQRNVYQDETEVSVRAGGTFLSESRNWKVYVENRYYIEERRAFEESILFFRRKLNGIEVLLLRVGSFLQRFFRTLVYAMWWWNYLYQPPTLFIM